MNTALCSLSHGLYHFHVHPVCSTQALLQIRPTKAHLQQLFFVVLVLEVQRARESLRMAAPICLCFISRHTHEYKRKLWVPETSTSSSDNDRCQAKKVKLALEELSSENTRYMRFFTQHMNTNLQTALTCARRHKFTHHTRTHACTHIHTRHTHTRRTNHVSFLFST